MSMCGKLKTQYKELLLVKKKYIKSSVCDNIVHYITIARHVIEFVTGQTARVRLRAIIILKAQTTVCMASVHLVFSWSGGKNPNIYICFNGRLK